MKVLLVGTGGVGEAIAAIAAYRDPEAEWLERMVLSDYDYDRARSVSIGIGRPERFPAERVDARDAGQVAGLIRKHGADLLLNGCDPSFNQVLFDTAYECGCNYMDLAMTLSQRHPEDPFGKCRVKLGDYQFDRARQWEDKGLLALVGSGVEPGMSDVFAAYAAKHFFDELEEIGVRDGADLEIEGVPIAFGFSIWTTIEECLNPPVIWERERGWFTTEPFSEPEIFRLPEGIGDVEMVNVEHEEVLLIPRHIDLGLKRVTFKYGLGDDFIRALKYLQALNLDRTDLAVKVGQSSISPRDFLAKAAPNPIEIGRLMKGRTCAGTWVKGIKDGLERQIYLYQVADNEECLRRWDCQSVVAQTAFNPVIMMELLAAGIWKAVGVQGPEAFDPDPFVDRMEGCRFPGGLMEMDSEYSRRRQERKFLSPLRAEE